MTLPNRHLAGQIAHLTRRTTQRQFLLKNDKKNRAKNELGYLLGLTALRHDQTPHALVIMSNHTHICITDNNGRRSDFKRDFHHLTTKVINKRLERRESLWSSSAPGDTVLLDTQKVIDTMLYIWLNPVAAGLVSKVQHWKHFCILPRHWGKKMRFKQPDYFRKRKNSDHLPEFIEFTPMPPAMFDHLPLDEVIAMFEGWIKEGEKRIRAERKKKHGEKNIIGMKACFEQSHFATPETPAKRNALNPRFSSTCVKKIAAAIVAMRTFWRVYKKRWEGFLEGSTARFPAGTVSMVLRFNRPCCNLGNADPHLPSYQPYLI